jgi:leucyl-tRNA synthetase
MMEFVNAAMKTPAIDKSVMESFILVLAPFAPHMAEEIWHRLGHSDTLAYAAWPMWDESLLVENSIELPIQINGKSRGTVTVAIDADKDTILAAAKAEPRIQSALEGLTVVKEIYVPGKIVNLVAK